LLSRLCLKPFISFNSLILYWERSKFQFSNRFTALENLDDDDDDDDDVDISEAWKRIRENI